MKAIRKKREEREWRLFRRQAAAAAMAGYISTDSRQWMKSHICANAIDLANELVKQLKGLEKNESEV